MSATHPVVIDEDKRRRAARRRAWLHLQKRATADEMVESVRLAFEQTDEPASAAELAFVREVYEKS